MWKSAQERRLLALCGIILPLFLIFFLNLSVLSAFLLCAALVAPAFILKVVSSGSQRNPPIKSRLKSRELDHHHGGIVTSGPVKHVKNNHSDAYLNSARVISKVSPYHKSPLKEAEIFQRSGYNGHHHDHPSSVKNRILAPIPALSPISAVDFAPQKTFARTQSPGGGVGVYASPVFSSSIVERDNWRSHPPGGLARSPLMSVRSPVVSPANTSFVSSSPQLLKSAAKSHVQLDYNKAPMFPLPNRHYPTHQPDYARTSMGILPSSSIFYGDGAASSTSPLRREGRVRTHSPVTIKIARPDNRRSISPLFRQLTTERSSGSPLHKDTVIAALNEKRKRIAIEEQDDSSSEASSAAAAGGGMFAKRRRLDDGSRCSTPSIGMSSNHSGMINGDMQSEGSADESTTGRESWMGNRGLQSRTPRNPIASSISSSRRASLANQLLRKRTLIQPAKPESSPPKKVSPNPQDVQADNAIPSKQPRSTTDSEAAKETRWSDAVGQGDGDRDRTSLSEKVTPIKGPEKSLSASRLKTPKLRTLGSQMVKNSSPPGEYTAADLEEDRHMAKERVHYILDSLKDDKEEVDGKDKPKAHTDQAPTKTVSFSVPPTASVSSGPTATSSAGLTPSNIAQLSKMNTLPVSSIQKGQLLLSSDAASGNAVKEKQLPVLGTSVPATSTQQTVAASSSGALTTGFLSSGTGMAQAGAAAATLTASSALGLTTLDSSKSGFTTSSQGVQSSLESSKSEAAKRDTILKGILAEADMISAKTSATFQLNGAPTNSPLGLMSGGKQVGTDQGGVGKAPVGQSLGGLLSQGTPLGGFPSAPGSMQSKTSQSGLAQSSTVPQLSSTTGSTLFSQTLVGAPGLTTAASTASITSGSSGFQLGAPANKTVPASAPSGTLFGLADPKAVSAAQSTFGFSASSQAPQNNTSASTMGTGGINLGSVPPSSNSMANPGAQSSATFQFGSASSTTAKTTASTLSFGAASSIAGGQFGAASSPAPSGLFNATTTTSSSIFGSAAAASKPSFAPAFGQATSAAPAQPASQSFNFATQPTASAAGLGSTGFQFKPAFGAPPQSQPSQSQAQPSKSTFQFGSSLGGAASNPPASSGGFTFNAAPASSSSSVFGSAAPAVASPFQSATSGTTGGLFGQQPVAQAQPPSFASATAQPVNAFGAAPAAGQSMFGGQTAAPAPSGGFGFGAQAATPQGNPPAYNFAAQSATQQPTTGGMFQFGQQAGSGQPAGQPMGSFSTPTKPAPFAFGAAAGAGSGFGTPAPSFGATTPSNQGSFSLGMGSTAPKRTSRMIRQARQTRRR